jgi:hypothetical protein
LQHAEGKKRSWQVKAACSGLKGGKGDQKAGKAAVSAARRQEKKLEGKAACRGA